VTTWSWVRPPRNASYLPLFQIVFMLQQEMASSFRLPDIYARDMEIDAGIAKFDLMLTVLEGEQGLRCCAEYNTALFAKADIRQMLVDYQQLLGKIIAQPDIRISELK
jgi:non-ribosomal peptide synthetase component F